MFSGTLSVGLDSLPELWGGSLRPFRPLSSLLTSRVARAADMCDSKKQYAGRCRSSKGAYGWGRAVPPDFIVIGVMVKLYASAAAFFGLSLGKHVTQSSFYDDGLSVQASVLRGRPRSGRRPKRHRKSFKPQPARPLAGDWSKKVVDRLNRLSTVTRPEVFGMGRLLASGGRHGHRRPKHPAQG